jgi:hypothetical protein
MAWLNLVSWFFGGAFVANAVPHFVSGVMGRPFPTPFAKPPGRGLSSSIVNVLWGLFNFVVAYVLLCRVGAFDMRVTTDAAAVGLGVAVLALFCAWQFGRPNGGNGSGRRL